MRHVAGDTWQWDDPSLENGAGLDQQYLATLFAHIQAGRYGGLAAGKLNTQRTIFSGFSDGSQMVSWLIELQARGGLPVGVEIAAGVMLSGGSHRCYCSAGQGAVGSCAACTDAGSCGGGSGSRGCSLTAQPLCCDYCCPANFTEDSYHANPERYSQHPPVFLAQSATSDFNADLCAAPNYFHTLQAYNVTSELVLLSEENKRCACVGQPNDTASSLSPLAGECALIPPEPRGDRGNCVDHVCGFASMVVPLTQFLRRVLAL